VLLLAVVVKQLLEAPDPLGGDAAVGPVDRLDGDGADLVQRVADAVVAGADLVLEALGLVDGADDLGLEAAEDVGRVEEADDVKEGGDDGGPAGGGAGDRGAGGPPRCGVR